MIKPAVMKKNSSAASTKSELVAIISDIHFDLHDVPTWRAFCKWHKATKPSKTVILGDFVDLGMLSRYAPGDDDPVYAINQIKCFVKEANALSLDSEIYVVDGNHDERWEKLVKSRPFVFKDAKGLTLKDQCYAQGLNKKINWLREDVVNRGLQCGPYILRHGHNQSGSFGGGKHVAANMLDKGLGENIVFGHFHRAQMFCKTSGGRTVTAIANPAMTHDHSYAKDPNWQRGFTVLELYGPGNKFATPNVVLIQDGHFAMGGVVFDGNK